MAKRLRARALLAARVTELMMARKLNRTELGKRVGLSQPQISQFLNGHRGLSMDAIDAMATFFDVDVPALFIDPQLAFNRGMLSELQQGLLDSFHRADARTQRSVIAMLGLDDVGDRPAAISVPVNPARVMAEFMTQMGAKMATQAAAMDDTASQGSLRRKTAARNRAAHSHRS